jgi:hypothetical protein
MKSRKHYWLRKKTLEIVTENHDTLPNHSPAVIQVERNLTLEATGQLSQFI